MHEQHDFQNRLASAWHVESWKDVSILVAVSGGADSVALLRSMVALKSSTGVGRIAVGHVNHGLRGRDADGDEAFVVQLCAALDVPLKIGRMDLSAPEHDSGDGLENAARTARYQFLTQAAEQLGARYVVLAHTADDQAETIVQRILRGTGLAGLAGIPRTRPLSSAVTLVRPLLNFPRSELLDYLESIGQPFRDDATNRDTTFTRNRIRHDLLPLLADQYNQNIKQAILRLGQLAGEAQSVIDELVSNLAKRCVTTTGNAVTIDVSVLARETPYVIREAMMAVWRQQAWPRQSMGFAEWDRLATMVVGDQQINSKQTFPGHVVAKRENDRLLLTKSG